MNLKVIVAFSLTFFILSTVSIIAIGLVSKNQEMISPVKSKISPVTNIIILSLQEIAKHNSISDCWIIVNSKVYNVTSELSSHPGGVETISPYCGKEATTPFTTKDRGTGNDHSSKAYSQLTNLLLGSLNQKITNPQ